MKHPLEFEARYEAGKQFHIPNSTKRVRYSPSYNINLIEKQYIQFIEDLIRMGKLDKAHDLISRTDRFPTNYSLYLRHFDTNAFKQMFPNLLAKTSKRDSNNFKEY